MNFPSANDVADELRGSAQSLQTVLENQGVELDDATLDWLHELDDLVLCCEQCGWWDDADRFNDDQVCAECSDE